MKNKITPSVILLIITVIFFIAGIFFMGIQARQQISDTEQSLDAFISQVKDKQQALNDAQTSFSSAVKEKKDLLNYRQQKACAFPHSWDLQLKKKRRLVFRHWHRI